MSNPNVFERRVEIRLALEEKADWRSRTRRRVRRRLRLYLSQRAWWALGSPERVALRRVGAELHIRPDADGLSIHNVPHGPRAWCGAGLEREIRAPEGVYDAVVRGGVLVVDLSKE